MLSSWKKRRSTFIDIKPNFEGESSFNHCQRTGVSTPQVGLGLKEGG